MREKEYFKKLEEYDMEVNRLFKENKNLKKRINKLESLIELLYYKIELNDEQEKILDEILNGEVNE